MIQPNLVLMITPGEMRGIRDSNNSSNFKRAKEDKVPHYAAKPRQPAPGETDAQRVARVAQNNEVEAILGNINRQNSPEVLRKIELNEKTHDELLKHAKALAAQGVEVDWNIRYPKVMLIHKIMVAECNHDNAGKPVLQSGPATAGADEHDDGGGDAGSAAGGDKPGEPVGGQLPGA